MDIEVNELEKKWWVIQAQFVCNKLMNLYAVTWKCQNAMELRYLSDWWSE